MTWGWRGGACGTCCGEVEPPDPVENGLFGCGITYSPNPADPSWEIVQGEWSQAGSNITTSSAEAQIISNNPFQSGGGSIGLGNGNGGDTYGIAFNWTDSSNYYYGWTDGGIHISRVIGGVKSDVFSIPDNRVGISGFNLQTRLDGSYVLFSYSHSINGYNNVITEIACPVSVGGRWGFIKRSGSPSSVTFSNPQPKLPESAYTGCWMPRGDTDFGNFATDPPDDMFIDLGGGLTDTSENPYCSNFGGIYPDFAADAWQFIFGSISTSCSVAPNWGIVGALHSRITDLDASSFSFYWTAFVNRFATFGVSGAKCARINAIYQSTPVPFDTSGVIWDQCFPAGLTQLDMYATPGWCGGTPPAAISVSL